MSQQKLELRLDGDSIFGSHVIRMRGSGSGLQGGYRACDPRGAAAPGRTRQLDAKRGPGRVSGTVEHVAQPTPVLTAFLKGMCTDYRDDRCRFEIRQ
jgi:hypothetical protein